MGLSEKLKEIKSEVEALTTYANGVTGESDSRLGDAVRTLANGFGGGGSGSMDWKIKESRTLEADTSKLEWSFDESEKVTEVYAVVIGRVNDSTNSLANAQESCLLNLNNQNGRVLYAPMMFIRGEGGAFPTRIHVFSVGEYCTADVVSHSSGVNHNTNVDSSPKIGGLQSGRYVTSIKFGTSVNTRFIKAGAIISVAYR